jgi:hypothetical protein
VTVAMVLNANEGCAIGQNGASIRSRCVLILG